MKILVIGDPHGNLGKIKKISTKGVDLILLTGDLGKADLARKRFFENVERKKEGKPLIEDTAVFQKKVHYEIHHSTLNILNYLSKSAPVYTIQGNVGIPKNSDVKKLKKEYKIRLPSTLEIINKNKKVFLIKNKRKNFGKIGVGFLEYYIDNSWIKEFKSKDKKKIEGARKETIKAKKVLKKFGKVEILVCHQPPFGFLDRVNFKGAPKDWQGKHAGGKAILDYVRKYQPRFVFCGHIHEGEGKAKIGKTIVYNLGVGGHVFVEL